MRFVIRHPSKKRQPRLVKHQKNNINIQQYRLKLNLCILQYLGFTSRNAVEEKTLAGPSVLAGKTSLSSRRMQFVARAILDWDNAYHREPIYRIDLLIFYFFIFEKIQLFNNFILFKLMCSKNLQYLYVI